MGKAALLAEAPARNGAVRQKCRTDRPGSGRDGVPPRRGGLEAEAEGGARCTECFVLRLSRTAEAAREGGYDYFATTLTVSPHKNAPLINAIGEKLAEDHGVLWLPSDFKKRDGYRRSIELSHEYGLYRQSWCGCGLPENF